MTIRLDPNNANTHNAESLAAVGSSLAEFGAGRSILADREGVVIAGNATEQKASELGIKKRFVHTNGDELIVVVRDDLATDDPRRKALALADNRTQELSTWDPAAVQTLFNQIPEGMQQATGFTTAAIHELLANSAAAIEEATEVAEEEVPDDNYREQYGVIVLCEDEASQQEVYERLQAEGYECRVVTT